MPAPWDRVPVPPAGRRVYSRGVRAFADVSVGSSPSRARHDHLELPGFLGAPFCAVAPATEPAEGHLGVLVLAKPDTDQLGEVDLVHRADEPVRIEVHSRLLRVVASHRRHRPLTGRSARTTWPGLRADAHDGRTEGCLNGATAGALLEPTGQRGSVTARASGRGLPARSGHTAGIRRASPVQLRRDVAPSRG